MRLANIIFAISMIILSLYISISSFMMGGSSSTFPLLTGIFLLISSVLLLIVIIIKKEKLDEFSPVDRGKLLKFIYTIILMIIYSIMIRYIGALIASILLFIGMALILNEDIKKNTISNYIRLVILSIVIVGTIYSIFKFLLNVPLPELF